MDAIFKMMNAAQRLRTIADQPEASGQLMRKVMEQVAGELMASAEKAAPKWGELTGLIRDLENGK